MEHELFTLLGLDEKALRAHPCLRNLDLKRSVIGAVTFLTAKKDGLELCLKKKLADTIFLFAPGHKKYGGYQGSLPGDLRFADSRFVVRKKLGKPFKSHKAEGTDPPMDLFLLGAVAVFFGYSADHNSVLRVSMTHADRYRS